MFTKFRKASLALALLLVIVVRLPGNVNAASDSSEAQSQMEGSINNMPSEWQNYVDSEHGFQVGYPTYGWTASLAFQNETQEDDVIRRRITISNEEYAFINIDIWNNLASLSIPEWIDTYQKSLLEPNATIPASSNITAGGAHGFFIVQPPDLDQQLPGRLITVLSRNGFIYRIEYVAQDGGTAQELYTSMLETFEFEAGDALADNLPQAPFFASQAENQTQSYIQAQTFTASSSCCNLTDPQYNPYPCGGSTGNCTWYAAYARDDLPYQNQPWGNAADWITYAKYAGYETGTTPRVGAVVVLQPGVQTAGSVGHVAVVIQKYSNTSFRVRHMNWAGTCVSETNLVTGDGVEFIYEPQTTPPSSSFSKKSPDNGVAGIDPTNVKLEWYPANDVFQYKYCYYSYDSGVSNVCDINLKSTWMGNGTSESVPLPTLVPNKTYYWQVGAKLNDNSFIYADDNQSSMWSFSTGSGYPSVNSIQRSNPNPTNAPTVNFTVTFSQPVTGVDVSDFALATTGISGANINSVNPVSGPSEVYTVNVNTGTGSGTIGLNLFDNDSIKNSQNSPLGGPVAENGNFTGEAYTVDKTLPVVYSSEATPDSINLITVKFTVKFFENVTGVTSDDFSLTTTGISGASISNVTGSGDTYTVIVNPGTGNGTIRLDVVDDDSIKDNVGNPLDGNFTGASFPINKTIESYIAGNPVGAYFLSTLQALRDTYAEDDGPLKVVSTNGMPIIAALRDAWLVNGQTTSFAQLMGLPQEQLSDTYYFPAYNNVTLSEQIRFANVDTVPTTVTVTIAGVVRGTYPLNPNEGRREIYALDTGPVEVKSSNGAKIIAAIRSAWLINGQTTSFAQLMGLPKEALSTTYWFPAYNNVTLSGQLRLAVP